MTVEEIRGSMNEDDLNNDQFPIGMRVLAVDDDLTCLRVLETLLRRCQYHVTSTTQAVTALKMLRENRNNFDLVISDVHMPDMDGFKLLELVGLEMDLPVIMLSGNGDTRLVMKGISHGACDYLLKPVRIEELKNIWQHVIRRKKVEPKGNNFDNTSDQGTCGGGKGPTLSGGDDQNGKLNRKRKEQNEEDDDDDCDENDNDDPSAQKKPRVVWSVELHRKFVAAVNQLGIDKAVPKKILDIMNVDRLTRENVASHLQKYRLYLKRISCVASQQANMVAALGAKDPAYLRMGSLDGFGDFHSFAGSGQLPNASLGSYSPVGMLGRLNTPVGLGIRGPSSGMMQLGRTQNSSNSVLDLGKLQQIVLPGNQNGNFLQGLPTSLELDQLQQNKSVSRIGEFSTAIDPTVFPGPSSYSDNGVTLCNSNNSFLNVQNNSLMLQGVPQQTQSRVGFGNQPSVQLPSSINSDSFQFGFGVSSHLPEQSRCNDNWPTAVPLSGFQSSPFQLDDHSYTHPDLSSGNSRDNISPVSTSMGMNSLNVPPSSLVSANLQETRRDLQAGSIGVNVQNNNQKFSNYGIMGDSVGHSMQLPKPKWDNQKQEYNQNSNLYFSSLNSSVPVQGGLSSLGQNNTMSTRKMGLTSISQPNSGSSYLLQHNGVEKSAIDMRMKLNEEFLLDENKLQGGINSNSCGSLEDLMSAMIKRERDELTLRDGDIGSDIYPVRTCM